MPFYIGQLKRIVSGRAPNDPILLNDITVVNNGVNENVAPGSYFSRLVKRRRGSQIALLDDAGGRFALNQSKTAILIGTTPIDYEIATSYDLIIEETDAAAANSPHQSVIHITINNIAEITLTHVSLDNNIVIDNDPAGTVVGTISGFAPSASLSLVDDAGGRLALVGNDIVVGDTDIDATATPTLNITFRQSDADATTPTLDTILPIIVQSAAAPFAVSGSLDPAIFSVPYSDSLTASGGTPPYSISGLPAYGPAVNVTGGAITFSGTPK